jgi:rod shape-determining protein MreD
MSRAFSFAFSLALALLLQIVELPDSLALARPNWPLLVIGYWALYAPQMPSIVAAWFLGLCCDVLFNAALGQHALALVIAATLIARLRGIYILFPLWQAALALAPIWALYTFLMFWMDGLTHHAAEPALRWLPVLSTTLLWPIFAGVFDGLRIRRARDLNRLRLP